MTTLLRGTMLVPGVSANRRLYTPELVQKAYDRLTERIKSGTMPVTMLTHHEAGDDSVKIAGRVTGVELAADGKLNYTAELADNSAGNEIAALVSPKDGDPFLRGVSIRGWWVGEPKTQMVEGMAVTTADDMEIDGLDFTKNPGVSGAFVVPASDKSSTESHAPRELIHESVEVRAEFTETAKPKPYGTVRYADPGYQTDKVKRFPLDTLEHAQAAWGYLTEHGRYTPAQMKRIKNRIKGSLKEFGVNVTETPTPLTPAATTLSEAFGVEDSTGRAGFSISAYNGPLTVTVSAYDGVDPADLSDVAMAAMAAACNAIHALDPDDDGDIDTGASEASDDNQMEAAPASETLKESDMGDTTPAEAAETPAEESTEVETPAEEQAEEETEADESAPVTRADLNALIEGVVKKTLEEAGVAAPAAEETPAVEESAEETPAVEDLRESIRKEVIAEALQSGLITRRGLVENAAQDAPEKPLHEMSDEEFRAYTQERAALFFSHNQ